MIRASQAYFQTRATTTSQGEVVILLYDGAISFLNRAIDQIKAKNYAEKGILISKALDVLNELDSTLNHDKGGDLANNLHALYFFCSTSLLKANLKMDVELVEKVIQILASLKSAFQEIVNTPEAMAAAQETAMGQRTQSFSMPKPKQPVQTNATAHVGSAKASSLYARKNAEFGTAGHARPASPDAQPQSAAFVAREESAEPLAPIPLAEDAPIPQMRLHHRNSYGKFAG